MASPLNDQAQTRLAIAALFAALARTLGEQDESFPQRFDAHLEKFYREIREFPSDPIGTLETLKWAGEMLDNPK
ncbi:hypothetical protein [Nisaea sp.]|uniref:hypothetical protein n=1 Tax=Nisaea sp. TaxID=2024842 RepID=UPI003B52A23E